MDFLEGDSLSFPMGASDKLGEIGQGGGIGIGEF